MPNSAGLRGSGYAANRTVRAPADGHIPADALDTGVRVSEVWFADAIERRSANWGISEDMMLALSGTGWRDLSRRSGLCDSSLEQTRFERSVPAADNAFEIVLFSYSGGHLTHDETTPLCRARHRRARGVSFLAVGSGACCHGRGDVSDASDHVGVEGISTRIKCSARLRCADDVAALSGNADVGP